MLCRCGLNYFVEAGSRFERAKSDTRCKGGLARLYNMLFSVGDPLKFTPGREGLLKAPDAQSWSL